MAAGSFEIGPIRPPSEAYSLLIRVTRNCPWNRCRFCHTYKGAKFELRPVAEIRQEIAVAGAIRDEIQGLADRSGGDVRQAAALAYNNSPDDAYRNVALWLYAGGESVFLQDANSLIMPTGELVEVIKLLKETFPGVNRITSYARAKTAARKKPEELLELREAGLSRVHMGLESGYDPLLKYIDKGVTAAESIAAGKKVVAAGISLCEYVILGLGGRQMWREHAIETARVLSEINPDYIRVRTLAVNDRMPLHNDIASGQFVRSNDEEIIAEERLLIEHLECSSNFVSDHVTNLLQEIEGKLPQDKESMLAVIRRFQELEPAERANFRVGRRVGLYSRLDDLGDPSRHRKVADIIGRIAGDNGEVDEEAVYGLMGRFI
ncbi:MAG: radical SAM protein [Chloroflexota bacterium]